MIALIQRVTRASVTVADEVTGEIGPGLLVLLGVEKDDDEQKANRLCERVLGYRIFSDAEGGLPVYAGRGYRTRHAPEFFEGRGTGSRRSPLRVLC